MKFINKTTKVIIEPKSEMVIEQFKKSPDYEVLIEIEKTEVVKKTNKKSKVETTEE